MSRFEPGALPLLAAAGATVDREHDRLELGARIAYCNEENEYNWGESVNSRRLQSEHREGVYEHTGGW